MSEGDVVIRKGPNIGQAALQFLRSSIGAKFVMAITGAGSLRTARLGLRLQF